MIGNSKATLTIVVTLLGVAIATLLSLSIQSSAFAAVGGTGNGGGGSSSGQYHTRNGHGWYKYDVDSPNGPEAFEQGRGSWSQVQRVCRNDNADKVAMFIVQARGKSPPRNVIVINDFYGSAPHWYLGYNGNNGGNWMERGAVERLFNQLPARDRQTYTFGRNVAWFCYQERTRWRVDSGSYVKIASPSSNGIDSGWSTGRLTAKPGDRLNFKHTLIARDADVDRTVNWTLRGSGFPSSFGGGSGLIHSARSPRVSNGSYVVRLGHFSGGNSSYTIYSVTQNDVGKDLCQRLEWSPTRWNDGGTSATPYRCANIPYNYSLVPRITVPDSDQVVDADRVTTPVRGTITASGPTKSHTNIQWRFTKVEYPANLATIPNKSGGSRVSSADPCTFFTSESSCSTVRSGTDASGIGHLASKTYAADALRESRDVGTKICFALSIRRNSSSSTDWRHSDLQCLIMGKTPKVQVHGGGLSVGRAFTGQSFANGSRVETSVTNLQGVPSGSQFVSRTFGSWAEYGIYAPGEIKWMASGSGLAGGSSSSSQPQWSKLTFTHANRRSSCAFVYGCYTPTRTTLPNVASLYPVSRAQSLGSTTSISPSELADRAGSNHIATTSQSTLTITGDTLAPGRWVVLNAPTSHVIISDNIHYSDGPFTRTSEIPQFIIIARDITISSNVTNVDAWLIANDALSTCNQRGSATQLKSGTYYASSSARLTASDCDRRLTVNGPVMANRLYLRRTAGSERVIASNTTRPGEPAEIFNMRPDTYLWMRSAGLKSVYKTTNLRELPPRY